LKVVTHRLENFSYLEQNLLFPTRSDVDCQPVLRGLRNCAISELHFPLGFNAYPALGSFSGATLVAVVICFTGTTASGHVKAGKKGFNRVQSSAETDHVELPPVSCFNIQARLAALH
jgi:hypothetical protein